MKSLRFRKKKGIKFFLFLFLGLLVTGTLVYFCILYVKAEKVLNKAYHPVSSTDKKATEDTLMFLVMGLDNNATRNLGSSRTDAMMLVSLNKRTKKMTLCSIPRDSFVQIQSANYTGMQRIESAYTYGGPKSAVDTVKKLFNIPIHHYVVLNFDSFIHVIDALGGIDVNVPKTFAGPLFDTGKKVHFEKGIQHLNGEEALAFSRERKIDNDIMRGFRQQLVLEAVKDKAMQLNSISKYVKIIESLEGQMQMDLNMRQIKTILQDFLIGKDYEVEQLTFDWRAFSNGGHSMVELYQDSVDHVAHQLRVSLGLEKKDARDDKKFQTNGKYKYKSDHTTATPESEKNADTFPGEGLYIGTEGNTKTGDLPNKKTTTGFYD
ncbi:LCP family protein [Listeria grandensis]|uniref:LCP family protein n=1 Tax=Listeria grandensis TaxID=1494963 RepID=UPI001629511C|nr:LCP family protein [Listeria grandensis]MBC1475573.1 LCP family protein [Listeria grandensis]